jgi:putative ATP-binding cassette transporter
VNVYSLVPRGAWVLAAAAVTAGLVSGSCSAGLIALINTALHRAESSRSLFVAGFVGLVAVKIGSQAVATLLLDRFAQSTLSHLCRDLSRRVLATPLARLEEVGIPRILATLTDDVAWLGWATQNVPGMVINAAVLAGCAVYLGWLSWPVLLAVMLVVIIGALGYRVLIARAYRYLQQARDTREALFQHFRTMTEGVKELKLHARRREVFLSARLAKATETMSRASLGGLTHHLVADTWSQSLFYGLVGGLLFLGPHNLDLHGERTTGYILVTLYMMNPVWGIIGALPTFARAKIALQKVRDLGLALPAADTGPAVRVEPTSHWRRLELDRVTFAYPPDSDGRAFVLGPIDLTLRPGELVFLVGGNGSGKSTLVKLLAGLYSPQGGTIHLDGQPITDDNREWYRQHFSVVFSDFYLFDALLGLDRPDLDAQAHRHLIELELDHKLQVRDGVLSTTALSQGQRKRLALLTVFLEDRPIYVFDEWAADQDPHYRDIFYKRLLPSLKARGKTVLVISHDDRYYHLGDCVVKLEYGSVAENRRTSPRAEG